MGSNASRGRLREPVLMTYQRWGCSFHMAPSIEQQFLIFGRGGTGTRVLPIGVGSHRQHENQLTSMPWSLPRRRPQNLTHLPTSPNKRSGTTSPSNQPPTPQIKRTQITTVKGFEVTHPHTMSYPPNTSHT